MDNHEDILDIRVQNKRVHILGPDPKYHSPTPGYHTIINHKIGLSTSKYLIPNNRYTKYSITNFKMPPASQPVPEEVKIAMLMEAIQQAPDSTVRIVLRALCGDPDHKARS